MVLSWKEQVFGAEPYEELQTALVDRVSQPDALSLIPSNSGMESALPSSAIPRTTKRSLFSRKPVKRTSADPTQPPSSTPLPDHSYTHETTNEPPFSPSIISREPSADTSSLFFNRSIIPETLKELPSWYHTEGEWAAATAHQFRARFPIHNPVGPRFYRNVHLLPPGNRPASVFSPSFPPMSTEPPPPMPGPSRTPSGSPLPTPSSSQIRIPDPSGKTRSRKPSTTAHDNVDLLDASDPYGTNWHHQSPYDGLGLSSDRSPVSPDAPDSKPPPRSRSRMSSLGAVSHHKTTTPSPLSQSTSAINLPDQDGQQPIARGLTKRRKPFEGIFGSAPSTPPDAASVAPSSFAPSTQAATNKLLKRNPSNIRQSMLKSASTSSIPHTVSNASMVPSEKRQKRGSLLGRFARRFSIMRRVTRGHSRGGSLDASNEWSRGDAQSLQVPDGASTATRPISVPDRLSSAEKRQSTRVPPPQVEATSPPATPPLETTEEEQSQETAEPQDARRYSTASIEVPYSIGRLTIANPDVPSSSDDTPVIQTYPLPVGKNSPVLSQLSSHTQERVLPIPAPTPAPVVQNLPMMEPPAVLTPPSRFAHAPQSAAPSPAPRSSWREEEPRQSHPPPSQPSQVPILRAPSKRERQPPQPSVPSPNPISTTALLSPLMNPSISQFAASASSAVNDSPLSRASIIANPPTPYVEPTRVNKTQARERAPAQAPVPSHLSIPSPIITPIATSTPIASPTDARKSPSREATASPTKSHNTRHPKSSTSVRSRETETFRLVRSPSAGAVQPTGQSIIVAGEQWEVVGEGTQRSKSRREKEESRRSRTDMERRESKRLERLAEQPAAQQPSKSESRKSRTKDGSSSRQRSSHAGSRDQERRSTAAPSTRASGMVSPLPGSAPERRPSQAQSRRPSSELTSAADMNALRAREVWEMDRLWKGRSMAYGLEGPHVVYAQSIGDVGSTTSVNGAGHGNGSAHTSYKVQQGFPFPSTQGIYSPPPQTMSAPSYQFPSGLRSYPDLATIPSIGSPEGTPSLPSRNPLPAPPRQSTYRPAPVPASFAERGDSAAAEYWQKYAGVNGIVSPTR